MHCVNFGFTDANLPCPTSNTNGAFSWTYQCRSSLEQSCRSLRKYTLIIPIYKTVDSHSHSSLFSPWPYHLVVRRLFSQVIFTRTESWSYRPLSPLSDKCNHRHVTSRNANKIVCQSTATLSRQFLCKQNTQQPFCRVDLNKTDYYLHFQAKSDPWGSINVITINWFAEGTEHAIWRSSGVVN